MIEFHAGSGPDSEAVGVALEEMFLDYRVSSGSPAPVIVDGATRIAGMQAILLHLAARTGRFFPEQHRNEIARWLDAAAHGAIDARALEAQAAASFYLLGEISIADMAIYPTVSKRPPLQLNTARWVQRMSERSATGRGMGAVARQG